MPWRCERPSKLIGVSAGYVPDHRSLPRVLWTRSLHEIVDLIQDVGRPLADVMLLEHIISLRACSTRFLGYERLPWRGFRPRPNAPWSQQMDVDVRAMVLDWVTGLELVDLADRHLASIDDEAWRLDQLSDFVSGVLEHTDCRGPWEL